MSVAPRIYYLVLTHAYPEHLGRLINALLSKSAVVVVHVDAKVDITPFVKTVSRESVVFVEDRVNVRWAGWSMVRATLSMLAAIRDSIGARDRVVLLSGDSYPLSSVATRELFFRRFSGSEFINIVRFPSAAVEKDLSRIDRLYLEHDPRSGDRQLIARAVNRLAIRRDYGRALGEMTAYCGSQWWALTGGAVRSLLAAVSERRRFARFARNTRVPDEFFFHTLFGNSPYIEFARRSLMLADFDRPEGPRPAPVDAEFTKRLLASLDGQFSHGPYGVGPVLFARKFVPVGGISADEVRSQVWPRWDEILGSLDSEVPHWKGL